MNKLFLPTLFVLWFYSIVIAERPKMTCDNWESAEQFQRINGTRMNYSSESSISYHEFYSMTPDLKRTAKFNSWESAIDSLQSWRIKNLVVFLSKSMTKWDKNDPNIFFNKMLTNLKMAGVDSVLIEQSVGQLGWFTFYYYGPTKIIYDKTKINRPKNCKDLYKEYYEENLLNQRD